MNTEFEIKMQPIMTNLKKETLEMAVNALEQACKVFRPMLAHPELIKQKNIEVLIAQVDGALGTLRVVEGFEDER